MYMRNTAVFAKISEARMHIKVFTAFKTRQTAVCWSSTKPTTITAVCRKWTEEEVILLCRLKDNAKAEVQETHFENRLQR